MKFRLMSGAALIVAVAFGAVLGRPPREADANNIAPYQTIYDTNVASAGYGGMRGIGTGTITLSGVTGTVTKALLFWHGPTDSADAAANAAVTFGGSPVVGTNIGLSSDNCWGRVNSQAYRADVTSLVSGNGAYALASFTKADAEVNGASLIVFFDDGSPANNRDVVVFDGNDSDTTNAFDANGWNVSLPGINYSSGSASLELHVSDGQAFDDGAVLLNSSTLAAAGGVWQGDSVPNGASASGTNGGLWDIRSWDATSFLSPGPNTLTMTSTHDSDCLSLIVAMIDLPAGAAPEQPAPTAVPTSAANATPCIGGIVSSRCPKNPPAVNSTPTPSGTMPAATATSALVTATAAPPQPTATQTGGGAAGVISAPDTGSGPSASGPSIETMLIAAVLAIVGFGASTAALRVRRR